MITSLKAEKKPTKLIILSTFYLVLTTWKSYDLRVNVRVCCVCLDECAAWLNIVAHEH